MKKFYNYKKNTLQTNHLDILLTQCNIVNLLFAQGKYINALRIYRQISIPVKTNFEQSHPIVSRLFKNIDDIDTKLKLQGTNLSEALQHLQKDSQ